MQILSALCLAAALTAAIPAQSTTCTAVSYGKSCGPVLTATVTPTGNTNRVKLEVSKVAPDARVILMVGAQQVDIPLAPIFGGSLDCRLLQIPVFFQQHRANEQGVYAYERALPATATGTGYAQFAVLATENGKDVVHSTNGVAVTCN